MIPGAILGLVGINPLRLWRGAGVVEQARLESA